MLETIIDFDPLDHAVWEDPHPLYRQLPKRRDFWAITRHADIRAGRLDWEHFSSDARTYVSLWRPTPAPPGSLLTCFTPYDLTAAVLGPA